MSGISQGNILLYYQHSKVKWVNVNPEEESWRTYTFKKTTKLSLAAAKGRRVNYPKSKAIFICFTINILGNTEKTLVITNVSQWSMEVINGENNLIYFRNLNMHKLSKHKMIMKSCTVWYFPPRSYAFQLSLENYFMKWLPNSSLNT